MQELARLHYLQSMGVTSYAPRVVLPAAKASVLCTVPTVSLESKSVTSRSALEQVTQAAEINLSPQDELQVIADVTPSSDLSPAALQIAKPAEMTIPPFCLLFVTTDSGLLFVADVPRGRSGKLWADNGRQFISEVLFAINRHSRIIGTEDFRWPISRHLPAGEAEAVQALSGFMRRVESEQALSDVVAMGGRARYFMAKLLEGTSSSLYQSHSLKSLFESGKHKALLWQQLQGITGRH
ncbi:hypothetical protein EDC56_1372 [Sinobacterium caligoides]|uniref:Uncharacterized protein n=1 Tax=Sinobacterium caligoides TaxID=933926 RepID=A0A3N2E135_9GAMM|nr:hypothetical protein [Sinobacterium caligoides]ROS05818.1 hypothetical protein EDC56_1372 [Sinobacterium caligoides]